MDDAEASGRRREIWLHRPTGEEFAVEAEAATGRIAVAHGPINRPANLAGGKFLSMTAQLLPPWLEERRAECDALPYEERRGVVEGLSGDKASVMMDDHSRMTLPVQSEAHTEAGPRGVHIEVGMPVVIVNVGDREPTMWPDVRRVRPDA